MTQRGRALAMLGAAAACAGLSVAAADRYAGEVESRVGQPVPVLVALRDLPPGAAITPAAASAALAVRQVPRRFAPPGALRSRAAAIGHRTATRLAAGDYVGEGQLRRPRRGRGAAAWTGDARVVEVAVAGARMLSETLRPGSLVDVLITTERARSPRTYLAVQRVPVVGFTGGAAGSLGEGGGPADGRVALRVTLRQAAQLVAADNFAREVRVVPRPAGDDRRLAPVSIAAARLGE